MVKILMMKSVDYIQQESGILDWKISNLENILNWGIHFGEGEGSIHITVGLLLMLTVALLITSFLIRFFSKLFTRKMSEEDKRKSFSIIRFIRYFVYLAVILITLSAGGIDITILITASAALFVAVGLALQQLFQDIIGGIFIIVDKSLQIGDVVEIGGKVGKVFEIKLRTTRAITRDDKVIIIPNHKFMSDVTYNYTQNYPTTREFVRVGVAYGSNVQLVSDILMRCAEEESKVSKSPSPFVLFDDFGESGLQFSIHFFITDSFQALKIKSRIRYMIDDQFRKHKISIPFPQRDVHLFDNRASFSLQHPEGNIKETP